MCSAGEVPDGPTLLVLYRRGDNACAFGLISMVNRAWLHAVPMMSVPLIRDSTKAVELKRLMIKSMSGAAGVAIVASALTKFTLGFGKNKVVEKIEKFSNMNNYQDEVQRIEAAARAFVFRLSKSADQFWEGGGIGSNSGKL